MTHLSLSDRMAMREGGCHGMRELPDNLCIIPVEEYFPTPHHTADERGSMAVIVYVLAAWLIAVIVVGTAIFL